MSNYLLPIFGGVVLGSLLFHFSLGLAMSDMTNPEKSHWIQRVTTHNAYPIIEW